MHDILILIVKGLAGGALVVVFALVSEGLSPKRFAGLFGAAPAVALAGLTIILLDKGPHAAHENAAGMIAGTGGMIAYAAATVWLLHRMAAPRAAFVGLGAWILMTSVFAVPVLVA